MSAEHIFLSLLLYFVGNFVPSDGRRSELLMRLDIGHEALHQRKLSTMDGIFSDQDLKYEQDIWNHAIGSNRGYIGGLPDSTLYICFTLVVSYMVYIIVMFFVQPKLEDRFETKNNPGLKVLLHDHRFHDNIVPAKIRNMYDGNGIAWEQTAIQSTPLLEEKKDLGNIYENVEVFGLSINEGENDVGLVKKSKSVIQTL